MYSKSVPQSIQTMFASIADDYDKANTTFSFGLHKRWNNKLIKAVGDVNKLLDLCAGTGEIGLGYLRKHPKTKAVLLDFCPEMLAVAEKKGEALKHRFATIEGDAQSLPFEHDTFDGMTISYGIRNVQEPSKCFEEVKRVLTPGGRLAILELTRPKSSLFRLFHKIYLRLILPILGKFAAKNIHAFRYLSKSIEDFASPNEIEQKLRAAGLQPIKRISLMGGLSTILIAKKPNN